MATLASKSRQHVLVHVTARSEEQDETKTREWVEKLMALAYDGAFHVCLKYYALLDAQTELTRFYGKCWVGVAPKRKFKVLVNPMGGKVFSPLRTPPILRCAWS